MTVSTNRQSNTPGKYITVIISILLVTSLLLCPHSNAQRIAVPAVFIEKLTLPGATNELLRPGRIYAEPAMGEVFIAEAGNNRILIFDHNNTFRYEFSGTDIFSAPLDVAVSSLGYIFVLGAISGGTDVFKFDFDGVYLGTLGIGRFVEQKGFSIRTITIDPTSDEIFLLDERQHHIYVTDQNGQFVRDFAIATDLDESERRDLVYGALSLYHDCLFVPLSSLGTVQMYTLDGEYIRNIGFRGDNTGALKFPVSVAVTEKGLIMVLDKHRFTVACFNRWGGFIGEFGGKGMNPGWYYHPTWLATDGQSRVYIGQLFQNKVEVCAIPDTIAQKDIPQFTNRQSIEDFQIESTHLLLSSQKEVIPANLTDGDESLSEFRNRNMYTGKTLTPFALVSLIGGI